MERFLAYRRQILETLRNVRWELIAINAMLPEQFAGPAFDDPKALRRYLAKHAH